MQVVIPMSGAGSRFARAGYKLPKPLIPVDGRPMIEHVIGMFPGVTDFLFVCSREHIETTNLESVLRRAAPAGRIVVIEPHKLGPVYAALQAEAWIRDDEPAIVNYCDFSVFWDFADFCRTMRDLDPAGAITAYRGFHPHTLGPNLYAYMRHVKNRLVEIREKHCFTSDRMNEFASSGTYYFRSGTLLKHYFHEAMNKGLQVNNEFYASMPFNLMVADRLPVHIYELEHFLQWGTPEDLEEYQAWSRYFADRAAWRPARALRGGLLIPVAGDGIRFSREGYSDPKPLVPLSGEPMIGRALSTLPATSASIAVCRADHLTGSSLGRTLQTFRPGIGILSLGHRTEGQASTCVLAESKINAHEPLLVAPCDCSLVYDEDALASMIGNARTDCIAFSFRNHPHANRNPEQYGWLEVDAQGLVQGVRCKAAPAGPVRDGHGITGMFWIREARVLFDAIRALIAQDLRVNGEFYLDSVLSLLIAGGRQVRAFDVEHYICYGTPDDVKTWEYWAAFFRKSPAHPFGKEVPHGARTFDRPPLLQRSPQPAPAPAAVSR